MNEVVYQFKNDLIEASESIKNIPYEKCIHHLNSIFEIWMSCEVEGDQFFEKYFEQLNLVFPNAVYFSDYKIKSVRHVMNCWIHCYLLLADRVVNSVECTDQWREKIHEMGKLPSLFEVTALIFQGFHLLNTLNISPMLSGTDYHALVLNSFGYEVPANKKTDYRNLISYLLKRASTERICRMNDKLYKPIFYDNKPTYAWTVDCTIKDWVRHQCSAENPEGYELSTIQGHFIKSATDYIENNKSLHVQEIKRDRHVFSFRNGLYFAKYDQFVPFNEEGLVYYPGTRKVPVAAQFFDEHFNDFADFKDEAAINIPTPEINKILDYQNFSITTQSQIWGLIGRCLYNINETHDFPEYDKYKVIEKWEVALCLYGVKNTGKSQIIHMIRQFYHKDDIGILENKMREIQGLEGLDKSFIVLAPDVKNDFFLDRTSFQRCVEGGNVVIQGMYKKGESVDWKPHIVFGFNENPYPDDPQGSVARRQAIIKFTKKVKEEDIDQSIQEKIEKNVGPHILKANRLYRYLIRINEASGGFWNFADPVIRDARFTMETENNPWANFLASENIVLFPGFYIPFSKVRDAFMNYKSYLPQTQQRKTGCSEQHYQNAFEDNSLKMRTITSGQEYFYPPDQQQQFHPGVTSRKQRVGTKLIFGMDICE